MVVAVAGMVANARGCYNERELRHPLSGIGHAMAFPIKHLPVVQHWDCHVTGTCCKYAVMSTSPS